VLREALPWITRWAGRTVVIKHGGSTNASQKALSETFAADIALLHSVGLRIVVVHGGGPQISALSERLGLKPTFVKGQRVTDAATLEVVRMVLLGQVNPQLAGMICLAGAPAVGVAGTDAGLIRARQADQALGAVGEVEAVDPRVLITLLDSGAVPVVATVGRDPDGQELNINADAVAGAIAVSLQADKLIYLTNVPGLYEDFGTASSTLLSEVSVERLRAMLAAGELNAGMIPKVTSIVAAFDGGIRQAHLLDGRIEHALLLEIFTDSGIGTMVTQS
jgi:acetylglutamate kinase